MHVYEKLELLDEALGTETLLDEIFKWFATEKINECLDDIAKTWDVYCETDEA